MRTLAGLWLVLAFSAHAEVGDPLVKWTWLMDEIEVEGIVRKPGDGIDLVLAINDDSTAGNAGEWQVWVVVGSEPPRGPFAVGERAVHTGIRVPQGAHLAVGGSGSIRLGDGGAATPDGFDEAAPAGFPAEGLRKYSLVVKIGPAWYQGGSSSYIIEQRTGTNGPDQEVIGAVDEFDLELDPHYSHLAPHAASSPPPWYFGPGAPRNVIHVESYADWNGITLLSPPPLKINHPNPRWPANLPGKGATPFMVLDPDTGTRTELRTGDHVRLIGRWCVENQHEDAQWTRFRGPFGSITFVRQRGSIKVGVVWPELHPFDYERIIRVKTPRPAERRRYVLALAAPIYDEKYARGGFLPLATGVADRVFVAPDGTNFRNELRASAKVDAPPLPPPFRPHASLVTYSERVKAIGIGMSLAGSRHIRTTDTGIEISAAVRAPVKRYAGRVGIADINDPANGRSILRVEYEVGWLPRLVAVESRGSRDPLTQIWISPTADDQERQVPLFLWNRGPDELVIADVRDAVKPARLRFAAAGTRVPPFGVVELRGTFGVDTPGAVRGEVEILSNDPAAPALRLPVVGSGVAAPRIEITPRSGDAPLTDFGDVRVGGSATRIVKIRNIGSVDVRLNSLIAMTPDNDLFQTVFVARDPAGPLLPRGMTREVEVTFTPTAFGNALATIDVRAETPDGKLERRQRIALRGRGTAPLIELTPDFVTFPLQIVRTTSAPVPVTLRNVGTAPLQVSGVVPADEARATTDCATVLEGATCTVFVSFAPKSAGARYSEVQIVSDAAGGTTVLGIRGMGEAAPILEVDRKRIAFPAQHSRKNSLDELLVVRNEGVAPLTVTGAALIGADPALFPVANGCTAVLRPEQICTIAVAYAPQQAGTHRGTLRILTAHGETADVALEGVATDP